MFQSLTTRWSGWMTEPTDPRMRIRVPGTGCWGRCWRMWAQLDMLHLLHIIKSCVCRKLTSPSLTWPSTPRGTERWTSPCHSWSWVSPSSTRLRTRSRPTGWQGCLVLKQGTVNWLFLGVFLMFLACLDHKWWAQFHSGILGPKEWKKSSDILYWKKVRFQDLLKLTFFWFPMFLINLSITFFKTIQMKKVGYILTNSGNLQQDGHTNFQNWRRIVWDNWS